MFSIKFELKQTISVKALTSLMFILHTLARRALVKAQAHFAANQAMPGYGTIIVLENEAEDSFFIFSGHKGVRLQITVNLTPKKLHGLESVTFDDASKYGLEVAGKFEEFLAQMPGPDELQSIIKALKTPREKSRRLLKQEK